jgi:hypothetical protein
LSEEHLKGPLSSRGVPYVIVKTDVRFLSGTSKPHQAFKKLRCILKKSQQAFFNPFVSELIKGVTPGLSMNAYWLRTGNCSTPRFFFYILERVSSAFPPPSAKNQALLHSCTEIQSIMDYIYMMPL